MPPTNSLSHFPARSRAVLLAVLACALPLLPLASAAEAATIPVDTLTDTDANDGLCSLREAIQAANDDLPHLGCPAGSGEDRVTIDLVGAIALGSDLPTITKSLTISGPVAGTLNLNGGNHRMLILNGSPNGRTLRLERLTIRNGLHTTGGGCITIRQGDHLEVIDSRVTACESLAEGGAVYGEFAGSITLLRSAIENSVAGTGSGGLFLLGEGAPVAAGAPGSAFAGTAPTATIFVEDSTISGNTALGEAVGGGLVVAWADGEIRRSTLSGNSTGDFGGGLVLIYGTLLLDSTTITSNTGDSNFDDKEEVGGGLYAVADAVYPSTINLHNTVIGNNFGGGLPSDIGIGASSAVISLGFNLIGVRNGADAFFPEGAPNANDDWVGSRSAPVVAGLAALADNGGPTKTHAPSPGSLLVDHGGCPAELRDQRGFGELATGRRPVDNGLVPNAADGCDIGAFESDGVELPFILFIDGLESGTTDAWSSVVP